MKITKEDKFRSIPGVNSDYNMVRFTVDCNFYEARKLREFIKNHDQKNVVDTFEYTDPNEGLGELGHWSKLITSEKVRAKYFKEGKFRVENWIWGVPGDDDGWASVCRWLHFVGIELRPKIMLKLGGMCELRKADADNVHKRFLGEYYEPETPC